MPLTVTRTICALALIAASCAAAAQTPAAQTSAAQTPSAPSPPPSTVREVVVDAPPRDPKVVASFPTEGASVPAGIVVLKLVFDQPMTAEAWSSHAVADATLPDCLARARMLADRRTLVRLCSLPAGRTYGFEGSGAPAYLTETGRAAPPFVLHFTTNKENTVELNEALHQAGLTEADDPIMDWNASKPPVAAATPPVAKPAPPPAPAR